MSSTLKVYGPPGTGKTTYLLSLLEAEAKMVSLDRVAFLTFTRAARQEVQDRTAKTESALPFCRTIHSICYRSLRVHRGQMLQPKQIQDWGKEIGLELSGRVADPLAEDPYGEAVQQTVGDKLLNLNHLGRHRLVGLRAMLDATSDPTLDWDLAKWFTEAYRKWKDREGLLDYTDLLTEYLQAGRPLDCDVMFVDEAQDLSRLQWKVIDKLGHSCTRVYLAGDDDQAIFTWAGASAYEFNSRHADSVKVLNQSWRCPKQVIKLAFGIVSQIEERVAKDVRPREAEGEVTDAARLTDDLLEDQRTFVLYRHHHRGRDLAKQLVDLGVPWLGVSSPLDDKRTLLALRAAAAWDQNPGNRATPEETRSYLAKADPRALKVRETEAGLTRIEALVNNADPLLSLRGIYRGTGFIQRCVQLRGWAEVLSPRVTLQSIHASKGQEADTVIIDRELSRRTWEAMLRDPDDEHRVFYVGVTRARNRLIRLLPIGGLAYEL